MDLKPHVSKNATISRTARGWRLEINPGDAKAYRLSQLDDCANTARSAYAWSPPLTVSLRARIQGAGEAGTWGFGLWNDPFGLGLGGGAQLLRLPALPQAIWFFGASQRNFLSLRDDMPGNGFFAQVLRSPRFSARLLLFGALLPVAPRQARKVLSEVIHSNAAAIAVKPEEFHYYRIAWRERQSSFWVDEQRVLEAGLSPRPPLGLVVWVDNQYAAFEQNGTIRWGIQSNGAAATLEIQDLEAIRG
jgi:hypothetical protein